MGFPETKKEIVRLSGENSERNIALTHAIRIRYQTVLIAVTGSNLEADKAGIKPETTPITPDIIRPRIILAILS